MRINRQNTLIQDHSYPLAGMREEDICRFFCEAVRPLAPLVAQVQGALLLHNIPFFCFIVVISVGVLYSFRVISDSGFPVFLYAVSFYPLCCLLLKIGGQAIVKSFYIKLPELSEAAPDRIRTIEEIVERVWKPALMIWRGVFFIYRTYLCPNVVDIIVFMCAMIVVGLIYCTVNLVAIAFVMLLFVLTFPALLTRKTVYDFLVRHFRASGEEGG